jgi:hypothetical protein
VLLANGYGLSWAYVADVSNLTMDMLPIGPQMDFSTLSFPIAALSPT